MHVCETDACTCGSRLLMVDEGHFQSVCYVFDIITTFEARYAGTAPDALGLETGSQSPSEDTLGRLPPGEPSSSGCGPRSPQQHGRVGFIVLKLCHLTLLYGIGRLSTELPLNT